MEPENLNVLMSIFHEYINNNDYSEDILDILNSSVPYQHHPKFIHAIKLYSFQKNKYNVTFKNDFFDEIIKFIEEHPNSYYIKSALYIISELVATTTGKQEAINKLKDLEKEFPNTEIDKQVDEVLKVDYLQIK